MGYLSLAVVPPCGGTTTLVEQHSASSSNRREATWGVAVLRVLMGRLQGASSPHQLGIRAYVEGRTDFRVPCVRRWAHKEMANEDRDHMTFA